MRDKDELIIRQRAYIDDVCRQLDITKTQLADKATVTQTTITRLFSNKINHALSATTLDKISRHLNVEPFHYTKNEVKLIGRVGALAQVTLLSEHETLTVSAPPEAVAESAEAIEVADDSNWPVYKKGEILYVVKDFGQINAKIDYLVVTENNEALIRMVQPGVFEGTFNLIWHNAPPNNECATQIH